MIARPAHPSDPKLREFIDRSVVPALLERFLRQHVAELNQSGPLNQPNQIEYPPSA